MSTHIEYPYIPEGRTILYVDETDPMMVLAKEYGRARCLDRTMPTASVVAREGFVLGIGANGSNYHNTHECVRVARGIKTGEGYELCEGCHPKNHSEVRAIEDAWQQGHLVRGADLYLWGHWWCCRYCWDVILDAEIQQVYLLRGSEVLFNKQHPDNIVGRQFTV